MKYQLIPLTKENQINKVLRQQKRSKTTIGLLFVSLWDDNCNQLIEKLERRNDPSDFAMPIYVIDSFTMPHFFVVFKTFKLPALVILEEDSIYKEDYLPVLIDQFHLKW